MAERLEQPGARKNPDFVRFESEEPSGLLGVKARRCDLPTQELGLFRVHAVLKMLIFPTRRCLWYTFSTATQTGPNPKAKRAKSPHHFAHPFESARVNPKE